MSATKLLRDADLELNLLLILSLLQHGPEKTIAAQMRYNKMSLSSQKVLRTRLKYLMACGVIRKDEKLKEYVLTKEGAELWLSQWRPLVGKFNMIDDQVKMGRWFSWVKINGKK